MNQILFIKGPSLLLNTKQSRSTSTTTCMTSQGPGKGGFGKKPPKRAPSKGEIRRKAASQKYDEMASKGMPEYTIWMRLKEGGVVEEGEQMPWLPVGSLAVPRSNQVADVIFETEDDLMQGATRLYPTLQNQPRDNIEFGYQLREFDDEEIRVAERKENTGWKAALSNFWANIQNPMNTGK